MRAALSTLLLTSLLAAGCGPGASGSPSDTSATVDGSGADASEVGDAIADDDGDGADDAAPSFHPLVPPPGGYAAIFLDVGQGDATLLIAGDGSTALIDGGVSAELLRKRLARLGVERIDVLVATHADADHVTGLAAALEDFEVQLIVWNGVSKGTQIFDAFLKAAKAEPGATTQVARRGDKVSLGPLKLEVQHPDQGAEDSDDHNNQSVVFQTGCPGAWLWMPGDAEAPAEQAMLAAGLLSDIDVLHAGHHGSASGTTAPLLAALAPKVAILSAGATNAYGHPDKEVVARLSKAGVEMYRTDIGWADDSLWMHADCKGGLVFGRVE